MTKAERAGKKRKTVDLRDKQHNIDIEKESNGRPAAAGSRHYTLSLAVAASCIDNAQNLELATLLAGQIARAAAIFNVDEVVVLDDVPTPGKQPGHVSSAAALFARVLQFMETPQYLKKALVPMHPDLQYAGMLPPLDAPHHLRSTEWGPYREGVVLQSQRGRGSWLDVGLDKEAHIPQALKHGARVTLRMGEQPCTSEMDGHIVLQAQLACPAEPREVGKLYWGYLTRVAPSLGDLLRGCPFQDGAYDLALGTSERGEQIPPCQLDLGSFKHLLLVIGGPDGLEHALKHDPASSQHSCPSELFHRYLNTCDHQGSRTIRSEEAVLISLAFLQPALAACSSQASGG